jgi:hypothetical protein
MGALEVAQFDPLGSGRLSPPLSAETARVYGEPSFLNWLVLSTFRL